MSPEFMAAETAETTVFTMKALNFLGWMSEGLAESECEHLNVSNLFPVFLWDVGRGQEGER